MDINAFFKSIIDTDKAPVVICDLSHTVVYMNPASISCYHKDITGKSIMFCHNADSCAKIKTVIDWFSKDKSNNVVFTSRDNEKKKDVYMVALRDGSGKLIGYYEKHEYRERETAELYSMQEKE